jgi:hypothetical protein
MIPGFGDMMAKAQIADYNKGTAVENSIFTGQVLLSES